MRQRTLGSYESAVRKHLVPGLGRHRPDRLRPEHLDHLYTALLEDGYSPATVLRQHRNPSRALTVAMQRGHVARHIATLVDPPAQKQSDLAIALTLDEARAVLQAAAHVRNSARWTVALALRLRQSETVALQWKDIDLLTGTLTVRRSIHRVRGGGLVYEEPKTRRSQRTLALPLPLVSQLEEHRTAQRGADAGRLGVARRGPGLRRAPRPADRLESLGGGDLAERQLTSTVSSLSGSTRSAIYRSWARSTGRVASAPWRRRRLGLMRWTLRSKRRTVNLRHGSCCTLPPESARSGKRPTLSGDGGWSHSSSRGVVIKPSDTTGMTKGSALRRPMDLPAGRRRGPLDRLTLRSRRRRVGVLRLDLEVDQPPDAKGKPHPVSLQRLEEPDHLPHQDEAQEAEEGEEESLRRRHE